MRRVFPAGLMLAVLAAGLPATADDGPAPTAAQYRVSANNLKQIALAFHNYAAANRDHLPNNVHKDGKGLLSWRVLILPYLEETPLYNQFKLDEPWDGPTNKALVEKMPKVYAPVRGKAKAGETFYRGFTAPRGLFGPGLGKGQNIANVPDGTSNTGLVFETGEPVVWTKPDDLILPEKGPPPKLGGMFNGVAQVAMADGSVRKLKANPDPDELRKLIDPADGHVIDFDKLQGK